MSFILALDQGTTSSRSIIFDDKGTIVSQSSQELTQYYPQPGWVEHDPEEIWSTQLATARNALALAKLNPQEIKAIGITNQRETTVVWNRKTGKTLCNAIVWQDRRTAANCDKLAAENKTSRIRSITGLVVDAYFSATKLNWILNNISDAKQQAENGELAFGTIDSWLLWKLTAGKVLATDPSNASRTMLFNLKTKDWDDELLKLFNVPRSILPTIKPSSGIFGETHPELLGSSIPICGIAGDQQAALFGQNCFRSGMVKNTYGTGCFMLMNIGDVPLASKNNLLTTLAWTVLDKTDYALEGSVFMGGATIQWLRDSLGIIKSAAEIESLASSVKDSAGVIFVPAFTGLGAPEWDPYARGCILGLTRGSTSAHIARAALEGIAFQVADLISAMKKDAATLITEIRVDGGACVNNLLMQLQADLLQVPVLRPKIIETTALGAAYLAGLSAGIWKTPQEIETIWKLDARFEPKINPTQSEKLLARWQEAVARSRSWAERA